MRTTERPPYKECEVCERKMVAPEKGPGGRWTVPPKKVCNNCTSFLNKVFKYMNANRRILIKTKKEEVAVFPLLIINIPKSELIGTYHNFESIRNVLGKYREEIAKLNVKVIDRKYHDFTDYFLPLGSEKKTLA
jgi:hypothetical protein